MKTRKYTNHLRVRLDEGQLKRLIEKLAEEKLDAKKKTKSSLIRAIIHQYIEENDKQTTTNTK